MNMKTNETSINNFFSSEDENSPRIKEARYNNQGDKIISEDFNPSITSTEKGYYSDSEALKFNTGNQKLNQ